MDTPLINLYDLLRAPQVKRWHILDTTAQQSLAEHSYMTAVIAMSLYSSTVSVEDGSGEECWQVGIAALFHDATEVRTGDIPTPAKALIRKYAPSLFLSMEMDLLLTIPFIGSNKLDPHQQACIKLADIIDASCWINDHGQGAHSRRVAVELRRRLEKKVALAHKESPAVGWYKAVNSVLTALGAQPINPDEERA